MGKYSVVISESFRQFDNIFLDIVGSLVTTTTAKNILTVQNDLTTIC